MSARLPPRTASASSIHGDLAGLSADDHPQYQLASEKNAASGYAGLDGAALVPTAALGSGSASASTYLRGDQTWATPAGGSSATTVEVDLGAAAFRGKFTITDAAISGTSKVLCWQAPGPYTNKGTRADEAEMQPVSVIAVEPAAGSAVVKWQTPPMIAAGQIVPSGRRDVSIVDEMAQRRTLSRRIGRVRKMVKFTYMVM